MSINWSNLTFTPTAETINEITTSWSWLLGELYTPILFTTLGDMFYESIHGIFWLNTGEGKVTRVASSVSEFKDKLSTDMVSDWFLPNLIENLMKEGKTLKPDYCYTYVILPIFSEGNYEPKNFKPVPVKEHFGLTGHIHKQIADLPDGSKIEIVWE